MKNTRPIKRAIETFIYVAVLATMLFHYAIANINFDSIETVIHIPKWPMYGMPILLAAGIAIFIAYPIYLKASTDAEE